MFPSKADKLFGVFVKNFIEELQKQNVIFTRLVLIKGQSFGFFKKVVNYTSHYFNITFGYFFSAYDLIYVHYISHHIPILFPLLFFKQKPWVLNAHGNDVIDLQKNRLLNFFAKRVLKKVDLVVVPTVYFKDKIIKNYPFLNDSSVFISPSGGVDSNCFYLEKDRVVNDIFTVGFVSRFVEEKGWKTFLDALVLLKDQNIYFKAILAGKGPDEENIKKYITRKELNKNVEFLGFVKQEELVHLYNKFDLYIFPTYREAESLGLTGVEAMACGTPVVACNISGPSTYVTHGQNGYLFDPKNHKQLSEIIKVHQTLLPEEKIQFSINALQTAAQFEQSFVAKELLKRLKKLL